MKKAIFVFLPLIFSLSVLTSQEIFTSGNFLYKVIGQSITITEYTGNNAIVQTPASIGDLPVTAIGDRAFYGCKSLRIVTIPSSVTTIGGRTFFGCTGLKNVSISSSVTTIGDWAFFDCTSLTSVTIPSSVIAIGNNAFSSCTNLTSVTLSRRTIVGKNAFDNGVLIHYRD